MISINVLIYPCIPGGDTGRTWLIASCFLQEGQIPPCILNGTEKLCYAFCYFPIRPKRNFATQIATLQNLPKFCNNNLFSKITFSKSKIWPQNKITVRGARELILYQKYSQYHYKAMLAHLPVFKAKIKFATFLKILLLYNKKMLQKAKMLLLIAKFSYLEQNFPTVIRNYYYI